MSEAAPTLLETLIEKRSALATEASTILDTASTEARDLTVEEEARAAALSDEMSSLSKEIELRESIERSRFAAAEAARSVSVKSEPLTYNREKRFSYFKDLATVQAGLVGDVSAAQERLNRHAAEMDVEFSKRDKRRAEKAETEMRGITGSEVSPFESRAGNRTDGTGGYFVPPIFLIDDYIQYLRYGRPFTNSLRQVPLPTGTDTINIPKLSTGTLTGIQTADNAALSNQDIADTQVTASVKTVGGYVDVSLQLLEQSPHQIIDEVILQDLIADYNMQVDSQSHNDLHVGLSDADGHVDALGAGHQPVGPDSQAEHRRREVLDAPASLVLDGFGPRLVEPPPHRSFDHGPVQPHGGERRRSGCRGLRRQPGARKPRVPRRFHPDQPRCWHQPGRRRVHPRRRHPLLRG